MKKIQIKCLEIFAKCSDMSEEELLEKYENEKIEMDSFDLFDFIVEIEEVFGIEYDEFAELTFHMTNLQDMLDYLANYIKNYKGENTKNEAKNV